MAMSRKDLDILRPMVDRAVQKFLGFSESSLVTAAVNCVDKGYDRKKTRDKLSSILDENQARGFTEKLFDIVEDFGSSSKKSRKRKDGDKETDSKGEKPPEGMGPPEAKKIRKFDDISVPAIPEPGAPSPGQLTADKIKDMMANAQRMIQQRKMQLQVTMPPSVPVADQPVLPESGKGELTEKEKRAKALHQKIQAQLVNAGLANTSALNTPTPTGNQYRPAPVILDELGRTIDVKTGEAVQLTHHMPTLKANIRAKRREQFKHNLSEKAPEDIAESKFFDTRVSIRGAGRTKRAFRFHEHGKFQQLAQRMRTKAQLEKLQADIAQSAKKTGIASAAKLATIAPKKELSEGEIPDTEWWDSIILRGEPYENVIGGTGEADMNFVEGITRLVEHPITMKPPAETDKTVSIPVILTKMERKKLRRQTRNEAQKETQEKIRLGLQPPPEPKVRMANLMRVLGNEAVQDPTKVEAHVRAQMAKRQKAHEEANAARKLTPDQRRDKKCRKLKEDTSLGVNISVYRVRNLNNPAKKFKVEANCKQLFMTGFVALFKDCNVVVVEGGPKQQKKFRNLMLHRIKWAEDKTKDKTDADDEEKQTNKCDLVWEGMSKNRAFSDIIFKYCPTETFAREQFKKHNVEHYWDLAYSGAVLEAAGDNL